ncbi:MAG: bifunctional proline dehydrogenase/L-glutamate gamma-semialdehyde dehydrogenase PutA, partial [Rhodomicrobium sp.]
THNAHTLSAIYHLARSPFSPGDYEFQCLHGMGETLYGHVVGAANLDRPCRIYAPVGTHETLLPYLVRRLLENGANSSFVRQLADEQIPISGLIADPVDKASGSNGAPHPMIVLPEDMFGADRKNSSGLDLSDAATRDAILRSIDKVRSIKFRSGPIIAWQPDGPDIQSPVLNPADHADIAGYAADSTRACVEAALAAAERAAPEWGAIGPGQRAKLLERAADLIEERKERLSSLIVREAGRTIADALSEVREAADFCRYYAAEARKLGPAHRVGGPVVCISPWNFPLAIFTGQIAASLAAGNPVLAKPAEQTPLIAAEAVRLLHQAGIPRAALQLLPGAGAEIGQALVADKRTQAVLFTGSTETARLIQRTLAARGNIPFIAETGGQNAMIVDSSALPEQAVSDILTSAFNSAGQRCSSLRILCLQEDIAALVLEMLKGAMTELRIGDPAKFETDIGPVIDEEAKSALSAYVDARADRILFEAPLPASCKTGTYVAPVLLEISSVKELTREVFGPVLHVIRFARSRLPKLLEEISATGYGLTLGIHSRIDETIDMIAGHARAGNVYVNRNMIGAVVGVQPFGGEGLSGTGPKAGGPLYLHRLLENAPSPQLAGIRQQSRLDGFEVLIRWVGVGAGGLLDQDQLNELGELFELYRETSPLPVEMELPGPVGESNHLLFRARGTVLAMAESSFDALHQFGAALATGNRFIFANAEEGASIQALLPKELGRAIASTGDWQSAQFDAVLVSGAEAANDIEKVVGEKDGPIIPVICGQPEFPLFRLVKEKTITINTAAAGGNASLMTIGG